MTGNSTCTVVTHIVSGDLWAGAEVQVYNLCRALVSSPDITITAVVFNEGVLSRKLSELGISVDVADESKLGAAKMIGIIRDHCRRNRTQLIHTHGFKENVFGVIAKELAGVPYSIRTVHGNPETILSLRSPQHWLVRKLDLLLGKMRQQVVVAVSTQLETSLKPIFPGKVRKIFNFIDVDTIRVQWPRSQLETGKSFRLGIVGRLVPVKRVDLFIKTVALLNHQGNDCVGVVIGSGPLLQNLQELAKQLSIEQKIKFTGFVDPAFDEIRHLDALMMTSDHEGLPMTLLEALALEIPVIAHRVGGIPEVLDHGRCGWLVDEQRPEAYAKTAAEVMTATGERRKKSQNGLRHATQIFGMRENARMYEELYTGRSQ